MTTIKETIEKVTKQLTAFSPSPRLDAELLIGQVTAKARNELFTHPEILLSTDEQKQLQQLVERRLAQEPIAYIVGHKEFWTLNLAVNRDVLIPRPETEMLVEWVLAHLPKSNKLSIADLGTGSGAIALAMASERPQWMIDATDTSAEALALAKFNAEKNSIHNVNFYLGEWCRALPHKNYQVIVGNPPYIKESDQHLPALIKYEPHAALAAGVDGLQAIRKIVIDARYYLVSGGWLVLEHGYDQGTMVTDLFAEFGFQEIKDYADLANLPRMIVGRR